MKNKRNILRVAFFAIIILFVTLMWSNSNATGENVARVGETYYTSLQDAITNSKDTNQEIVLVEDVQLPGNTYIDGDITIDLNGHSITAPSRVFIVTKGNFTLKGTGSVIESTPDYSPIMVISSCANPEITDYVTINVGKDVFLEGWAGIFIGRTSNTQSSAYGVTVNFNGTINSINDTNGDAGHGIYINGNVSDTTNYPIINIGTDSKITSKGVGCYAAGYAKWNIAGGSMEAVETAIEVRAGIVNITDGNFKSTYIPTEVTSNGNGSTTAGAALAVAQHNTKLPITVTVNGGTYTAFTPFYQSNPQNNSQQDLNKISLSIKGGTFNTIATTQGQPAPVNSVYSENFTKFITGGVFSKFPNYTYIADGYEVYETGIGTSNYKAAVFAPFEINLPKDTIILNVGDTANLGIEVSNQNAKDYVIIEKLSTEESKQLEQYAEYECLMNENAISLEGEAITALKAGVAVVGVGTSGAGDTVLVIVYDVKPETASDPIEEKISDILSDAILSAFENGDDTILGLTEDEMQALEDAFFAGKSITAELSIGTIKAPSAEELNKIVAKLSDGETLAGLFDINVIIKADEEDIANIRNLGEKIELEIDISSLLSNINGKFSVIRIHNGVAEVIAKNLAATNGKIKFETDRFSTYAVAYTPEDTTATATTAEQGTSTTAESSNAKLISSNPTTGDYIIYAYIAFAVSVVGMIVVVLSKKK